MVRTGSKNLRQSSVLPSVWGLLRSPSLWIVLAPFAMGCGVAVEGTNGELVGETDQALYGGFLDDGDGAVVELRVGEGGC